MAMFMDRYLSKKMCEKLGYGERHGYTGDGTPMFKTLLYLIGRAYPNNENIIDLIEHGVLRLVKSVTLPDKVYHDEVCDILMMDVVQPSFDMYASIDIVVIGNKIVHCGVVGDKFTVDYKLERNTAINSSNLERLKHGKDISKYLEIGDVVPTGGCKDITILGDSYSDTALLELARTWMEIDCGSGDNWVITPSDRVFRVRKSKEATTGKEYRLISTKSTVEDMIKFMRSSAELIEGEEAINKITNTSLKSVFDQLARDADLVPLCNSYAMHPEGTLLEKIIDMLNLSGHILDDTWIKKMKVKSLNFVEQQDITDADTGEVFGCIKEYSSNQIVKHNRNDLVTGGKDTHIYEVLDNKGRNKGAWSCGMQINSLVRAAKIYSEKEPYEGVGIPKYISIKKLAPFATGSATAAYGSAFKGAKERGMANITSASFIKLESDKMLEYSRSLWSSTEEFNRGYDCVGFLLSETDEAKKILDMYRQFIHELVLFESKEDEYKDMDWMLSNFDSPIDLSENQEAKDWANELVSTGEFLRTSDKFKLVPEATWLREDMYSDKATRIVRVQGLTYNSKVGEEVRFVMFATIFRNYKHSMISVNAVPVPDAAAAVLAMVNKKTLDESERRSWTEMVTKERVAQNIKRYRVISSDTGTLMQNIADIRYDDVETCAYLYKNKIAAQLFCSKQYANRVKIMDNKSGDTLIVTCIDSLGQIVLVIGKYGNFYAEKDKNQQFNHSALYGAATLTLYVKDSESVNRLISHIKTLPSLETDIGSSVGESIIRTINSLQLRGIQDKSAYRQMIEDITDGEQSDIYNAMLEFIGVPKLNTAGAKSKREVNCSVEDMIELQKSFDDDEDELDELDNDDDEIEDVLEEDMMADEDEVDSEDAVDDEDDEFGGFGKTTNTTSNETDDDDDEFGDFGSMSNTDVEDDSEDEDDVPIERDESLGSFVDKTGVKVTWGMVMRKVCSESDELKSRANDKETLRLMWMSNYIKLQQDGRDPIEALKTLWE